MTSDLRRKADLLLAELTHAKRRASEEEAAVRGVKESLKDCLEAQRIVQVVAEAVQQQAHRQIASVVTSALRSVFGDGSEFHIEFKRARGKTEARLTFANGDKEESPLEASSGGKVDVASLALRLVAILLARPQRRRLLVLDEPLKHLHGETYRENARLLIEEMAAKMNFQIIYSTGFEWLRTGKIVDVSKGEIE